MPSHLDVGDPTDDRFPDVRYNGIFEGQVIENRDPQGLGRVRVTVPGIIDRPGSAWAFPTGGVGGGTAKRGAFDVPPIGAAVYVFFLAGDVDKPRFFAGHYGAPGGERETPTEAAKALDEDGPEGATQVKTWETEKFALVFDDRDQKSRFYIYTTSRGQELDGNALMIELDNEQGTIAISATAAISLRTLGHVEIDALTCNIMGRKVLRIPGKPI